MTVESALAIMAVIDQHGPAAAGILHQALIESPELFWENFFELLNPDNPIRELAVELLESGEVTPETNRNDALEMLFDRYDKRK